MLGGEDDEGIVAVGGVGTEGALGGLSDWGGGDWPSEVICGGGVD